MKKTPEIKMEIFGWSMIAISIAFIQLVISSKSRAFGYHWCGAVISYLLFAFFFELDIMFFWYVIGCNLSLFIIIALLCDDQNTQGNIQDKTLGSAKFSCLEDALGAGHINNTNGLLLGNFNDPADKNWFFQSGHILTCAPTGAGKGISAVIPNLLSYEGSMIVNDIKGENYSVTATQRRAMGQEVWLLDPFKVTGDPTHRFNPIDELDPDDPNVISYAGNIADMLVISSDNADPHWDDTCRDFIKGLLIYIASLDNPDQRNLLTIRLLLFSGQDVLDDTLASMAADVNLGFGIASRSANTFMLKADKEQSGLLSSIGKHTTFLDDPRVSATLSGSDFKLSEIKDKDMTVYLVIPPAQLTAISRYIRLFFGSAINGITATSKQPSNGYNVAFLIDEFAQLGYMKIIEDNISLVRGYGATFWLFVQDLSQIKSTYKRWQSLVSNTTNQYFGIADYETAKYISDTLGQQTITYRTTNTGSSSGTNSKGTFSKDGSSTGSSDGTSEVKAARCLMTADELLAMDDNACVVFPSRERPYILNKINYLTSPLLNKYATDNPYHIRLP